MMQSSHKRNKDNKAIDKIFYHKVVAASNEGVELTRNFVKP